MVLQENFRSSAIMVSISCRRPLRSHGDRFCFPPTLPAPVVAEVTGLTALLEVAVDFDEVATFLPEPLPLVDLDATLLVTEAVLAGFLAAAAAVVDVALPFGLVDVAVLFPLLLLVFLRAVVLLVVDGSTLARLGTGPFCGVRHDVSE